MRVERGHPLSPLAPSGVCSPGVCGNNNLVVHGAEHVSEIPQELHVKTPIRSAMFSWMVDQRDTVDAIVADRVYP